MVKPSLEQMHPLQDTAKVGKNVYMQILRFVGFVVIEIRLTRPGCTIRVMCSVTVEVRAVLTEELYTESGSAGVLSSVRCCYSTECEETGHLLPTSGGGG